MNWKPQPGSTPQPAALWWGLLLGLTASLLLPKALLVAYYGGIWVVLTATDLVVVFAQDVLLAAGVFLLLARLLPGAPPRRGLALAAATTALLVGLLLDARVRQVWLRPTDLALVRYGLENLADLASGAALVFDLHAGWGWTFRRILVVATTLHLAAWALLLLLGRRPTPAARAGPARRPWTWALAALIWLAGALALVAAAPRHRYRVQENLVVASAVSWIARGPQAAAPAGRAEAFDQPPRPALEALQGPRRLLAGVRPFRNLVLVFLESVRWREVQPGGVAGSTPNLLRLAKEGLAFRCYVPVAHSSKGYFAVLTGRYPFPGTELREAARLVQEGLPRTLRDQLGLRTWVFASLHLPFERTGGTLASLGVDRLHEVEGLARAYGVEVEPASSFGSDDARLYALGARALAEDGGGFLALFLPGAAHYPYVYPGKPDRQEATHQAYLESIAYTDRLLGGLFESFAAAGLDEDTLFVLVGDHGESFGEHGAVVHNSSLFEEEITVPLIFWSKDRRLAGPPMGLARQIDVAPTILDLLGVTGASLPVQGQSLLRAGRLERVYLSTFYDDLMLGVVDYPHKYIYEVSTGRLDRYDLEADPLELAPGDVAPALRREVLEALARFEAHQQLAFPE